MQYKLFAYLRRPFSIVCMPLIDKWLSRSSWHLLITHLVSVCTSIYIYIYIYTCVCISAHRHRAIEQSLFRATTTIHTFNVG